MARKNKLKKTRYTSIYELEAANGMKNFVAVFSHEGTRYGERNLTKLFGCNSAKQAFEKLHEIKINLSKGIDVFEAKAEKVDDLMEAYFEKLDGKNKSISKYSYEKHAQPVIGHLLISRVKKEHIIKIGSNMEEMDLSPSTIKKLRSIINPIFKEAYESEVISRNCVAQAAIGDDVVKPPLPDRLAEPMLSAIRKIYNTAMKQDDDIKAMFLTSIMCARRFGEILDIEYEDIIDGVVYVRAGTTKSFKKLNPLQTAEKYPLPKEVLNIIGKGKGKVFSQPSRVYMDKYAEMIDTEVNLKLRPLAKDYPIRSHSNRNFLISIQSKKYGKDYVGSVCLSHAKKRKSDINDRYLSFEIEDIKEVFEDYWEKLRGNID